MNIDNNITNDKSPRDLKDEVINDLKKVRSDIDAIKRRATPGQIIDDVVFFRRGPVSPAETFQYLKDNPVGTSFLAVGTLLLMEDAEHRSYEGIVKERAGEYRGKMGQSLDDVKIRAKDKMDLVHGKVNEIKSKMHKDKGISQEALSGYGEVSTEKSKVSELKESAKEKMEDAKSSFESMKSGLGQRADSVKGAFETVSTKARGLEPLTYMALGAGLGAMTGAALPLSEKEKNFVDEKLQDRVSEFRRDLQDALNKSANVFKSEFIGGIKDFDLSFF